MLKNNISKALQRRFYTFVNTVWGFSFTLFLCYLILLPIVTWIFQTSTDPCRLRGKTGFCSTVNFRNNIGDVDGEQYIAYGPIDVVYTWVNGSDPVWKAKKEFWAKKFADRNSNSVSPADTTNFVPAYSNESISGNISQISSDYAVNISSSNISESNLAFNSSLETASDKDAETMTANRYRDSEELRYSLRSLVKNAPWIRHIYLVTDNQIPYWLNLDSSKLTVLSHEDIFANKSHLPVFSSPAIEANLHNIPGISKKFIYFNDDVFLGAPTSPDDFVSLTGAQKFVMAWDVPKCAPGCSDSWIGDGYCDRACNVSECNWDYPDCVNGSNVNNNGYNSQESMTQTVNVYCNKYCPDSWLADKICDQRCKIPECGWDIGDCGLDLVLDGYHGITLDDTSASIQKNKESPPTIDMDSLSSDIPHATPDSTTGTGSLQYYGENAALLHATGTDDHVPRHGYYGYGHESIPYTDPLYPSPALVVPYGTFAVYFNLSMMPCKALAMNQTHATIPCNVHNLSEPFMYTLSNHDDFSKFVIHQSILLNKHNLLVVTLFYGQDEAPRPVYYPYTVTFNVEGSFPNQAPVKMTFSLQIIDPDDVPKVSHYLPEHMELVENVMGDHVHASGLGKSLSFQRSMNEFHSSNDVNQTKIDKSSSLESSEKVELLKLPIRTEKNHVGLCGGEKDTDPAKEERFVYLLESESLLRLLEIAARSLFHKESSEVKNLTMSGVLEQLKVATTITLQNNTQYYFEETLLQSIVEYTKNKVNFQPKSLSVPETSETNAQENHSIFPNIVVQNLWFILRNDFRDFLESSLSQLLYDGPTQRRLLRQRLMAMELLPKENKEEMFHNLSYHSAGGGILMTTPLPLTWENFPSSSLHLKVEIGLPENTHPIFDCWRAHNLHNMTDSSIPSIGPSKWRKSIAWTHLLRWGRNMSEPVLAKDVASEPLPVTEDAFATPVNTLVHHAVSNTTATDVEETPATTNEPNRTAVDDHRRRRRRLHSQKHSSHHHITTEVDTSTALSQSIWQLPHLLFANVLHPLWTFYTAPFIHLTNYITSKELLEEYAWSVNQPEEFTGRRQRRKLLDTYAQSLIHVNRLYNKAFGNDNRKVPAHVPHMIDKEYMVEMQNKWSVEWTATSSHRFRAVDDMQYAFAYYYYVMNRRKMQPPDLLQYLTQVVDTNNDKFIDPNEWKTLLSVVFGSRFSDDDDLKLSHCVQNPLLYADNATSNAHNHTVPSYLEANISFLHPTRHSRPVKDEVHHRHVHGQVVKSVQYIAYPRISELLSCPLIVDALKNKVDWTVRQPTHVTESDKDLVAFEMIGDNMTESLNQLNSIRQRQSKFICVNDNMQDPSPELAQELQLFFEALFPTRSVFELPENQVNPTLYLDEYRAWQAWRRKRDQQTLGLHVVFSQLHQWYRFLKRQSEELLVVWAFHVLDSSSNNNIESNNKNKKEELAELKRIQQRLRQDATRDPLAHVHMSTTATAPVASSHKLKEVSAKNSVKSSQKTQDEQQMWQVHVAAWMMVAGLLLILLLRVLVNWRHAQQRKSRHAMTQRQQHHKKHDDDDNEDDNDDDDNDDDNEDDDDPTDALAKEDMADDEENHVLHRLRSIERRLYQNEDDTDDEEETRHLIERLQQTQPYTNKVPLVTPLREIRTYFPFSSNNNNVNDDRVNNVSGHDQVLGYRPTHVLPPLKPVPVRQQYSEHSPTNNSNNNNKKVPPMSYPKRFQTFTRPVNTLPPRGNHNPLTTTAASNTTSSTSSSALLPKGHAAEVEVEVEEVVVVDDRVFTADDDSYLRKYSAAMLEDAAGTGPGTSTMQLEIFSDGAWTNDVVSRSRSNSESFTAPTFPSHNNR